MDEQRALFTQRLSAEERAGRFVEERRARIEARTATPLQPDTGGRLVVHVVPLDGPISGQAVDPVGAQSRPDRFRPMGPGRGFSWRLNLQGLCFYDGEWPLLRYTQLFRSGAVEGVLSPVWGELDDGRRILAEDRVGSALVEAVPHYLASLESLDVAYPMLVAVALQGVRRTQMPRRQMAFRDDEHSCDEDTLPLPDFVIERQRGSDEVVAELSRTLDVLWNAYGHERCRFFTEDRQWKGGR